MRAALHRLSVCLLLRFLSCSAPAPLPLALTRHCIASLPSLPALQWELALELFREMHAEGCRPNVVTYNSLIAACAQGG